MLNQEKDLPEEVYLALTEIAEAKTLGLARRGARIAYVDNHAPKVGQDLIQEVMARAKHRLGQPPENEWVHEMSW